MEQRVDNDHQYQETTIERVREFRDRYELKHHGSWVLLCPKVEGLPAPKVGETLRTYGRGIGFIVRGIVIEDRVYRYETEAEDEARHQRRLRSKG